ncbi:uncharacterized protein LOC100371966 [Saccoglossus kowalevskii]|uniref:Protein HEXIM-like n=1 Tax=Saccoglossus kowalevskii TaxID=10224 RepID=A0ABM0M5K5_SACKO|nr:PREDICTED: protein HEXIM-like [Saccoglossus kowalevskii]
MSVSTQPVYRPLISPTVDFVKFSLRLRSTHRGMPSLERRISGEFSKMEADDQRIESSECSPDETERSRTRRGGATNNNNHRTETNGNFVPGKKKHRRGKNKTKRRWKPYTEMTWKEKKNLEDREAKRAEEKRKHRLTPYNTTQFLMEDHKVNTPDFNMDGTYSRQTSMDSSDELCTSDGEVQFFEKDFSETYERLHEEALHSMIKTDLVKEFIRVENYVTELEESLKLEKQKRQRDKESRLTEKRSSERKDRTIEELNQKIVLLTAELNKAKMGRERKHST